jgi:hypothetical protein
LQHFEPIHDEFQFLKRPLVDIGSQTKQYFLSLGDNCRLLDGVQAIEFSLLLVDQIFLDARSQ